ncbi:hypothetical protein AJ80_03512 [Polytolypa hystricis UAMH7299]|uniref:Cytochrome P450 monooxygenase n=1 Tax=Polytolypa hystricis (strain UAMH7299) TaxID=1447883 RepID=A0A2B7YIR8_POLH7|nr:hypothetical protein AJ80_03512 [Polytolypa hystricis UAMH7299]
MDLQSCAALSLLETLAVITSSKEPTTRASLKIFLLLLLGQYTAVKLYRLFIYPSFLSPLRHLPGPKDNHPLLGQELKKFRATSPNEVYLSWTQTWPDAPFIKYMSVGNSEQLLVNSLEAHKEVLQAKCYSFVKPVVFTRLVGEIVGKGLLFAEGDEHKKQRRLLAGPFSLVNLRRLLPVFQAEARNLSDDIDKILEGKSSGVVEVSTLFSKATLRIIGVAALGADLGDPNLSTFFHECYHRIFEQSLLGNVITAINAFIPIRRFLPIEANLKFVQANTDIRALIRRLIRQRMGEVEDRKESVSGKGRTDLLTYMIEQGHAGEDAWTEDDILGHVGCSVMVNSSGHETTALATVWASYVLATRPDIQDRLRSEITGLLQQSPTPDYNEIESLRFLNNFCREVLRVHCPTVTVPREAAEDVVVSGVLLPKGTTVHICPQVVHSSPSVWGSDASVFDPDRWDRLTSNQASPYALEAFINGPRICIGRTFALLEYKTLLIELVSKWRFAGLDQQQKVEVMNPSLTLKPKRGLKVVMEMLR